MLQHQERKLSVLKERNNGSPEASILQTCKHLYTHVHEEHQRCAYMHVHVVNTQGNREAFQSCVHMHVNSVNEARQSKATMPDDNSFFSQELPQVGFEPATFCVLGRCSTN